MNPVCGGTVREAQTKLKPPGLQPGPISQLRLEYACLVLGHDAPENKAHL